MSERASASGTGRFFYGWVVVFVAACLGFLGTGFYSYSRGVFLPSLAEDLGDGSRFAIAMGFSIAGVTTASTTIPTRITLNAAATTRRQTRLVRSWHWP